MVVLISPKSIYYSESISRGALSGCLRCAAVGIYTYYSTGILSPKTAKSVHSKGFGGIMALISCNVYGIYTIDISEQLTFADDLQYPDIDNHHNNRYEDDYSQLPDEELCLKHASSR